MGKLVCRNAKIEIRGRDVSHWVSRWAIIGKVGEVYEVELDLLDDDRSGHPVVIEGLGTAPQVGARGMTGGRETNIVTNRAKVTIDGEDVSSHTRGWDRMVRVGEPDIIRLYLHADGDVIVINDTIPWADDVRTVREIKAARAAKTNAAP